MRYRVTEAAKNTNWLMPWEKIVFQEFAKIISPGTSLFKLPINKPLYTKVPLFQKRVSLGFHGDEREFLLHGIQKKVRLVGKA